MDACLDVRAVHAEPIAAQYDVAFSFVVHNGAVYLDKSLGELVSIGRRFRKFWIFYVENDSTDGTQLILTKFGATHPERVHGEMLRNYANSSLSLCRSAKYRNCVARVALLAALRQRAFDNAIRSHATWRVLIVVDMDWVELTVSALLQAFAIGVERKASAVFALSVYRNSEVPVPRYVPYDRASAVLDAQPAFERGRYLTSPRFWYAVQDNFQCVVRVKSAFGGVGIYYSLRSIPSEKLPRYTRTRHYNQVPEHVHFNRQLLDLHKTVLSSYSGMYMDPRFRPVYGWGTWTQSLHSKGGQRPGHHAVFVPPPPPWAPTSFSDSIDSRLCQKRAESTSQRRGARDGSSVRVRDSPPELRGIYSEERFDIAK